MEKVKNTILKPLDRFNWYSRVNFANTDYSNLDLNKLEGSNVIHWGKDIQYEESHEANEFVKKYLSKANRLETDAELLRFASDSVTIEGEFLEMGVFVCSSINFIAALNPRKRIYGFDSFSGFPEDWNAGYENSAVMAKDTFSLENTSAFKDGKFLIPVLKNVTLFKGYFNETLPIFKELHLKDKPIAFLHIDCDLYSSTKDVFTALGSNIVPGTVIVFDELYNYPNFEQDEWKALQEFQELKGFEIDFIAFNSTFSGVAILIK